MTHHPMLDRFNDEELRKELDRREAVRAKLPVLIPIPDWGHLVAAFEDHNKQIANGELTCDGRGDFVHSVYEAVASTLYGPGYWDWYRQHVR